MDAWKHPIVYNPNPPGSPHPFTLYAPGPTGESGGDGNIDFWAAEENPNG